MSKWYLEVELENDSECGDCPHGDCVHYVKINDAGR